MDRDRDRRPNPERSQIPGRRLEERRKRTSERVLELGTAESIVQQRWVPGGGGGAVRFEENPEDGKPGHADQNRSSVRQIFGNRCVVLSARNRESLTYTLLRNRHQRHIKNFQ